MKHKIQVLEDSVVNKIAAGEIVERPSSVVRELVDNSIDAGADDIFIELEDGGTSIIRVSDNGSGMSKEDLELSLKRHATSKITAADDLNTISTLGFRGEALPSIASVSKLKVKTRRKADEIGSQVFTEGGKKLELTSAPVNVGTSVEMRSLFFNTPARKKFLKKAKTEEIRVKQWLLQYAVAHPKVRFRLQGNAKDLVNLPAVKSSLERAESLIKGEYESITQEFGKDLVISGCFGHPGHAQLNTSSPVFLINGRVVQDRMLARAVRDGYQSMLKASEKPVAIVCIDIDPKLVDVNVHPQKSEVRFIDSQAVFRALRSLVTMALSGLTRPVEYSAEADKRHYLEEPGNIKGQALSFDLKTDSASTNKVKTGEVKDEPDLLESDTLRDYDQSYRSLRFIGQVLDCYLICERGEEVLAIDMHAAHERINYNKIRVQYKQGNISSQKLLVGLNVDLTEEETERLKDNESVFESFGFSFGEITENSILVKAAPATLTGGNIVAAIKEACSFDEDVAAEGALSAQIDHLAARIACHASVRSGRKLKEQEVYELLATMDSEDFASACPHGRPVTVSFSRTDVEKWFGRDS